LDPDIRAKSADVLNAVLGAEQEAVKKAVNTNKKNRQIRFIFVPFQQKLRKKPG